MSRAPGETHGGPQRVFLEDAGFQALDVSLDFEVFDRIAARGSVEVAAFAATAEIDVAPLRAVLERIVGPKEFGKMFPDLEPFRPPRDALVELGRAMLDSGGDLNHPELPAGFTYLSQFVDHDVTLDLTQGFPDEITPEDIEQGRIPTLDLDSLYGFGPEREPDLYRDGDEATRARFKVGVTTPTSDVPDSFPNDLPRRQDNKQAIIGDPRNDENLVLAQLTVALLKFHNKIVETLEGEGSTPFERTQRLVRWHYQWIVLNDLLPRVIDPDVLRDVRENGRKFYDFDREPWNGVPFMPLEFSVAAYRLGHSLVRGGYNHNRVFTGATLEQLFGFTGPGGLMPPGVPITFPTLPSNWIIDWRRFFKVADPPPPLNVTRKLDTGLAPQLHELPFIVPEGAVPVPPEDPLSILSVRNLVRGRSVGLPAAQDVAKAIGATALTPDEIAGGSDGEILRRHGFHERTPLWYYILKEAELQGRGERLGEVGSRILAEVFVGLLEGDEESFLSEDPEWKPTLPAGTPGTFTMADLLRFVNDLNPIGGDG